MTIFKRVIFSVVSLSLCLSTWAGNEVFIQSNRNPVLFHPSNAGGKKVPRLNTAGGLTTSNSQEQLFCVAMDSYSKRLKSGLGIYYLNSQSELSDVVDGSHLVGIAISPKLNVMSTSNHKKAKYTFSPALFFDFGNEKIDANRSIDYREYYSTGYSADHPNGESLSIDSTYNQWISNDVKVYDYTIGLGFQLIGKRFFIQAKVPYKVSTVNEQHKQNTINSVNSIEDNRRFYTSNIEVGAGYSIVLNRAQKMYLTGVALCGYRFRWNDWSADEESYGQLYYGELKKNESGNGLNTSHLSILLRKQNFVIGGAVTSYNQQTKAGGSVGYYHKKLHVLASLGALENTAFVELTTTYLFIR